MATFGAILLFLIFIFRFCYYFKYFFH